MTPPTIRAELARAIRVVNVAFNRLDANQQARVRLIPDGPLDAALLGEDRNKARAQIERWRDRQLAAIAEVAG
jgi:hypothetical protein